MVAYYKENISLYTVLLLWLVVGMYGGPLIYVILPATVLLMKQKRFYEEMLLGLWFILILSDNHAERLGFAMSVKTVYVLLLTLFVLFDQNSFKTNSTIFKLYIPFFLIAAYCILYSDTPATSVQKTLSYLIMFLIIPTFVKKLFNLFGINFFRNLIFFGTTILILGFIMTFLPDDGESGRFKGIFGNPNGLGLFCFLFFVLFFVLNNLYRNLFSLQEKTIIYFLLALSIILSNSRNSLLSVLILLLLPFFYKKSLFLGILFTIIFIFLALIISNEIPFLLGQFGLDRYFRVNTTDALSGRAVAWLFAWNKIQDNLFIGKGFGYDEHMMALHFFELEKKGHQGGVHNSFLSLWLDFGLVGLLLYCRSFFLTFIKATKLTNLALPIMCAVLFSASFEGLFIGSLNPQMIILLIIMTIITDEEIILTKVNEYSSEQQNGLIV